MDLNFCFYNCFKRRNVSKIKILKTNSNYKFKQDFCPGAINLKQVYILHTKNKNFNPQSINFNIILFLNIEKNKHISKRPLR